MQPNSYSSTVTSLTDIAISWAAVYTYSDTLDNPKFNTEVWASRQLMRYFGQPYLCAVVWISRQLLQLFMRPYINCDICALIQLLRYSMQPYSFCDRLCGPLVTVLLWLAQLWPNCGPTATLLLIKFSLY